MLIAGWQKAGDGDKALAQLLGTAPYATVGLTLRCTMITVISLLDR